MKIFDYELRPYIIIFYIIILLYIIFTNFSKNHNIYFYILIIITIILNIIFLFSYIITTPEYKKELNKNNINIRIILTNLYLVIISLYYLQDVESRNLRWVISTINFKYTMDMLNTLEHLVYNNPYYKNILKIIKIKE